MLLLALAACGRVEEYDDAGVDGGGDDTDADVAPDATPDGDVTADAGVTPDATPDGAGDTEAPTITIHSGVADGGATNDTTPTWSFTVAGDPTTVECRVDGATFGACATSYTAPALAQGTHTFTIRASDAAGNQAMVTRGFTIDTTPPTIALGQVPASPNPLGQVSYTWSSSGGVTSTECRALYQLDTVPLPAWQPCSSPHTTATFTHPGTITLVFDVRVRDAAGNVAAAQDTFSHYVID